MISYFLNISRPGPQCDPNIACRKILQSFLVNAEKKWASFVRLPESIYIPCMNITFGHSGEIEWPRHMSEEVVLQSLKNELVLKLVGSIIIHQDPRPIDGLLANSTDSDMGNLRWIILRRFVGGLCVPCSCTAEVQLSLFYFLGKAFCKGQFFSPDMYNLVFPNGTLFFISSFPEKSPCIVITMIRAFVLGKRLIAFVTCNL